jgi:hypothetical protein
MDDLERFAVTRTHEGTEYRFRSVAEGEPGSVLLAAAMSWIVFGPISVVALALPGAAIVEALGWWLVNEAVLITRWIWIGVGVWIPLVLAVWVALQASGRTRVWITQHSVAWKVGLGRWKEVAYSEVDDIWTELGRVVIRDRKGRLLGFPIQDGAAVLGAAGGLLATTWRGAQPGDAGQIPQGLRQLLAQRAREG